MSEQAKSAVEKKPKKKGPIRFEAIIPVFIITALTVLYFKIFFDRHLKGLIEYVGTQANGAEVNVGGLSTSFVGGSFNLDTLEVTDKEKPTLNALEIGNVHFKFLWDALLRMKFVVEDASITNIQIAKPRKSPGRVLPPEPAHPSKMSKLQDEVLGQVRNKYKANMLGDVLAILGGGDYKDQIQTIRESLKSEARIQTLIADAKTKKEFWDTKLKSLSDTTKLKSLESQIQLISKEKDFLKQASMAAKLNDDYKALESQYKDIKDSSTQLKAEVSAIAAYPKEVQALINEDIASLKGRFSIPKIDFKDMAMHLFAGQFAEYIAKARKYQALAKQYMPEKKEDPEVVVPPRRSEGKNYQFRITTGYPLFWLKRSAISSKGTTNSYSGDVSGELTNVTTDPKYIQKPVVLDLKGNFPTAKVFGARATVTLDHTKDVAKQSALIQASSFHVPERMFVNDGKLKFGFVDADGSATFKAELVEGRITANWISALSKPKFLVETNNKLGKELLDKVLAGIPVININGTATGSFNNLSLHVNSNLGEELATGFTREIGAKVKEAEDKLQALVDEKIKGPQKELNSLVGGNSANLSNLNNLQDFWAKNQDKIKQQIEDLKSGKNKEKLNELKDKGKKLLKGFKF